MLNNFAKMEMKKSILIAITVLFSAITTAQGVFIPISQQTTIKNGRSYFVHRIEAGQTMYSICKTYKVTEKDIIRTSRRPAIQVNEIIYIPVMRGVGASTQQTNTNHQALTKTVRYMGVELRIPKTWIYTTEMFAQGRGFQIVCSTENSSGDINAVLILWTNEKRDLDGYLDFMKGTFKMYIPAPLTFSQNKIGVFQNYRTWYSTFSWGTEHSGMMMVFHDKGRTFYIQIHGDKGFYNSRLDEKILATIKL